jgi:hypothetical protein
MAQRIKGQEVEVLVVVNGVPQTNLTDILSFDVTPAFEIKEEEYLGETSKRFDEIFNGVSFSMELHFEDAGVLTFMQTIKDRAERRLPGTTINVKATLNFPNGERPRIMLKDCYFGDMPLSFGGRSDYGTFSIDGQCTDIAVL